MDSEHVNWHGNERKYDSVHADKIPHTETLQDVIDRTLPMWDQLRSDIKNGRNVMVVAHANSLRGLIAHIDSLSTEDILKVGIPNGIPLVYKFDPEMRPIPQRKAVPPLTGEYLEKRGLLREALAREEAYAGAIEGLSEALESLKESQTRQHYKPASKMVLESLSKLEQHRKVVELMNDQIEASPKRDEEEIEPDDADADADTADPNLPRIAGDHCLVGDGVATVIHPDARKKGPHVNYFHTERFDANGMPLDNQYDCISKPLLVIIRHGKTEHNKLGLFTGWEDASLAEEGRAEAQLAGKIMQEHQMKFDIVYTSWLSRAIETAWIAMNELEDSLWLPIVKTWRLNERMYGALTGLSKKSIRQLHGQEQFMRWRRGYDTRPPAISSFSHECKCSASLL
jgi:2,3-bisphosphoglycerate-dependent phosphoglycerate mutase